MSIEAMKQALEKATEVMEAACIRVDELKAENESLRQAIAEAEKQDHIRDATKMVEQEPVAWIDDEGEFQWIKKIDNPEHTAFYTHTQPKREWVGLTHEEIDYQAKKDDHAVYFALGALWAEAKLKDKNGF